MHNAPERIDDDPEALLLRFMECVAKECDAQAFSLSKQVWERMSFSNPRYHGVRASYFAQSLRLLCGRLQIAHDFFDATRNDLWSKVQSAQEHGGLPSVDDMLDWLLLNSILGYDRDTVAWLVPRISENNLTVIFSAPPVARKLIAQSLAKSISDETP